MAGMIAEEEEEVPQQVPDVPQQETCVYQEVYRRIKEGLRSISIATKKLWNLQIRHFRPYSVQTYALSKED
ncbi:unnamed protein product [Cochlearia groenlandica]